MLRTIRIELNNVSPVPSSIQNCTVGGATEHTSSVNLGELFQQYWQDSYPAGPPKPDPSRFEYLELISARDDFRLHDFVAQASLTKRREICTDLGQAFCRHMLQQHFEINTFAHMSEVINRPAHPAFGGVRVVRTRSGDIPDYLCSARHGRPFLAEAKGRFSSVSFSSARFQSWREQFERVAIKDRNGRVRVVKGFVVATRFATDRSSRPACVYLEDPDTIGDGPLEDGSAQLGRGIAALHYGRVLRKLDLLPLASALELGYELTRQLGINAIVWTCMVQPFQGVEFVGGYYRTTEGRGPVLADQGWLPNLELGAGHAVFVGLQRTIAQAASHAARGNWNALYEPEIAAPNGLVSSEFSFLPDGTVIAPATDFLPTGRITL